MATTDGGNAADSGPDVLDGGNASSQFTDIIDGGNAATVFPVIGPLVTGFVDAAPCPRVVVNMTETTAGTVTATLHRMYDDRDEIVPGADGVPAIGGFVRTDYYAPVGVQIAYRVEMFDANGASLGFTDAGAIILNVPDSTCWISSPYDPAKSVMVELDDQSGSALRQTVNSSVHLIGGRRIVITEASYGYESIPLSFWVSTKEAADAAEAVFIDGLGLSVIRVAPPMAVPRLLYAYGMPTRQEVNLPGGVQDTFFDLTVDEASAPTTVIIAAVLTYARYVNNLGSYAEFTQMYGTYRDALLNPPAEV